MVHLVLFQSIYPFTLLRYLIPTATASGDELRYGNQRKANLEIGFDAADIGILIDNLQALSGPNFSEKPTLFGVNSGIGKPYLKVRNTGSILLLFFFNQFNITEIHRMFFRENWLSCNSFIS